ncbi:DUF6438 domain-containing protein [Aequorivita sp. SDUM287046]|uniref:DUF6438 domain-containing protein n=1 Tax=Aequorivita aurantiaca TaxID=3053356 RepID=A0ABT8DKT4_9FLAO|nr:DUF6438 domain-containing protein [Aequorivita aurantiaca]MDN3725517.1 DUF6438 domain-containing protein [Aequorivita aurantiaca]
MKKLKFISLFFILSFVSCKSDKQKVSNNLIGEWTKINKLKSDNIPPPPFYEPFGIGFTDKKIEVFNGFKQYDQDSITKKRQLNYKGTFADYKVQADSIFILNPFNEKWEFKWKIKKNLSDTLILTSNDSTIIKLERINSDSNIIFDQIIFSSSYCYGSCPVIDISIDNKNKIYFHGENYVNPLGFYESKIDSVKTKYIFSKFGKANIDSLQKDYRVGHTDDATITTTFIKNGEIVKTIHDYGKAGPKELVWAYVPIENLYTQIELDELENNQLNSKIEFGNFKNANHFLPIEKSESFFLWTEINKSKIVTEKFNFKYSITYWQPETDKNDKEQYKIDKIETDGRFFKFYYKNQQPVTYDLGYDFIERNFDEADFYENTNDN